MPIEGRSLKKAANTFREHLNQVLAKTITPAPVSMVIEPAGAARMSFRSGGVVSGVTIATRRGEAELFLLQVCDSDVDGSGLHQLRTQKYTYTITPAAHAQPLLRWEYVRDREPEHARWCRHHLQGPVKLSWGDGLSLNDWHLPTGYVPFEEVIRFCIDDLGVKPLSAEWHEVLDESYRKFTTSFSTYPARGH